MRKLALTLLLAASLPAFATTATDEAAQIKLTSALAACAAKASCKQEALEAALESGLSVKAVLDTALKTSSDVDAVAIVTKAALNTDKSVASVVKAAKQANISDANIKTAGQKANVKASVITASIVSAKKEIKTEVTQVAQLDVNTLEATAADAPKKQTTTPVKTTTTPPVNACGISPNKPC